MNLKSLFAPLGLAAALVSSMAFAQEEDASVATVPFDVRVNGGINTYTGALGDLSKVGASFGALATTDRAQEGGGPVLDVEVGYEGSENRVTNNPLDESPAEGTIWRHNVSGLVKGGMQAGPVEPYVGAGIGGSYINVTDAADAAGFRNDWLGEIPLAAGLDVDVGPFVAGIRGTYRFLMFGEFAEPSAEDNNPNGNILGGQLHVGGKF